jgi:hypothetical protein
MPKLRNVSPQGALDVFGRRVERGAEFEVTDQQAERLLKQPRNFEPVKQSTRKSEKAEESE